MERMNIKEKAKIFATEAHEGQIRKSNGKPMIYHPIAVAEMLEDFGYDDEIVAAGYLHDYIEDTKRGTESMRRILGDRIVYLVKLATEPNKSIAWEKRKISTIMTARDNPINDVAVILADKIHNIEDTTNELKIQGLAVFNCFNASIEQILWYYESVYKSVSQHDIPIVKRLEEAIINLKEEIEYQTELEKRLDGDVVTLKKKRNSLLSE